MLLDVRESQFHSLLALLIELLGVFGRHPQAMSLDQAFVFAPFHAPAAQWVSRALLVQWAGAAILR